MLICIPEGTSAHHLLHLLGVSGLPGVKATLVVLWCRESIDFLLPAMITFLNDRDWQLRAAFFHHICEMGAYAGNEGLQAFLLPCLEQVSLLLLTGIQKPLQGFQNAASRDPERPASLPAALPGAGQSSSSALRDSEKAHRDSENAHRDSETLTGIQKRRQ